MVRIHGIRLLVIVLVLLCVSGAVAEENYSYENFHYSIKEDGSICITSYDWSQNKGENIVIPEQIDGHIVTEIGEEAFLNSLYINPSRKDKAAYTITIRLPETITTIGKGAFFGAFDVIDINIPASVQSIGSGAFCNMRGIKSFSVDRSDYYASIGGAIYSKKTGSLIAFPVGASTSSMIEIPEGIVEIGDYAFFGLKSNYLYLSLPSTLKVIGAHAFDMAQGNATVYTSKVVKGNALLSTTLDLGTVEHIGKYAFTHCSFSYFDLSKTTITELPDYCLYGCTFYKDIMLNETIERIGKYAFSGSMFGNYGEGCSITIPATVSLIDDYAFAKADLQDCEFSIAKDSKLKTIGEGVFLDSKFSYKFKGIVLPESVESIGSKAFMNAKYINSVSIPAATTQIGENICDQDINLDVVPGSTGEKYAIDNGFILSTKKEEDGDDVSWLQGFIASDDESAEDNEPLEIAVAQDNLEQQKEELLILHSAEVTNTKGLKAWKDTTVSFTNKASSDIKYITFYVSCYNRVGDSCGGTSFIGTGPYEKNRRVNLCAEDVWKDNTASSVTITSISITYMDGSSISYNSEEVSKLFDN